MASDLPANDPKRGYLIELDKPRYLRITLGAMRRMEEVSGLKYNSPEFAEWGDSLDGITAMVWAGLLHEDPDLSLEQASELVENAIPWQIREALIGATTLAMVPLPAGGTDTPRPLAPNRAERRHPSTGTPSGASASTTSDDPPVNSGS